MMFSANTARAGDISDPPQYFAAPAAQPALLSSGAAQAEANGATPALTANIPSKSALAKLQGFGGRASELAMHALGLLGIRYRMGGSTPENGLDCSGMVRYVFKQAWNANLPRTAEEISHVGEKVDAQALQPGDLVFYNTLRRGFSHVGIYLGDNKFIHSPSAGGQVRIESMDISYWRARFSGARRVTDPAQQ